MMRLNNSHGISLIAAIFIIVILAFMGVIFVTLIGTGSFTSVNDLQSAQALYVAEGGVQYALQTGVFPNYTFGATVLGGGNFTTASQYIGPGGIAPATVTNNPLSAPATTIDVTSTANYIIPGVIRIDTEYIHCAGTSGGNQFTACTRGWAGSAAATHNLGSAVSQCIMTSSGAVGSAARTVRVSIGSGSTSVFGEEFPNAASIPVDTLPFNNCMINPAIAWCYNYTIFQGRSLYDAANNAPGSTGGSLEAYSNATPGARIAGYRQRYLSSPLNAGDQVVLSLWFQKVRGHTQTRSMDMSVSLVDTTGALYTLWQDTQIANVPWTQAMVAVFTVPAGRTIDRIRLYFDIQNRLAGGGSTSPSYVWFDSVSLVQPGGSSLLDWQEVVN